MYVHGREILIDPNNNVIYAHTHVRTYVHGREILTGMYVRTW